MAEKYVGISRDNLKTFLLNSFGINDHIIKYGSNPEKQVYLVSYIVGVYDLLITRIPAIRESKENKFFYVDSILHDHINSNNEAANKKIKDLMSRYPEICGIYIIACISDKWPGLKKKLSPKEIAHLMLLSLDGFDKQNNIVDMELL